MGLGHWCHAHAPQACGRLPTAMHNILFLVCKTNETFYVFKNNPDKIETFFDKFLHMRPHQLEASHALCPCPCAQA
jgi:hypothetical protein